VIESHFIENPSTQFPHEFDHSETKMQQISSMVSTLQTNSQTQDNNEVLIIFDSGFCSVTKTDKNLFCMS
jgi:hypothetical protein